MKKVVAMILIAVMIIGLIPVSITASANERRIEYGVSPSLTKNGERIEINSTVLRGAHFRVNVSAKIFGDTPKSTMENFISEGLPRGYITFANTVKVQEAGDYEIEFVTRTDDSGITKAWSQEHVSTSGIRDGGYWLYRSPYTSVQNPKATVTLEAGREYIIESKHNVELYIGSSRNITFDFLIRKADDPEPDNELQDLIYSHRTNTHAYYMFPNLTSPISIPMTTKTTADPTFHEMWSNAFGGWIVLQEGINAGRYRSPRAGIPLWHITIDRSELNGMNGTGNWQGGIGTVNIVRNVTNWNMNSPNAFQLGGTLSGINTNVRLNNGRVRPNGTGAVQEGQRLLEESIGAQYRNSSLAINMTTGGNGIRARIDNFMLYVEFPIPTAERQANEVPDIVTPNANGSINIFIPIINRTINNTTNYTQNNNETIINETVDGVKRETHIKDNETQVIIIIIEDGEIVDIIVIEKPNQSTIPPCNCYDCTNTPPPPQHPTNCTCSECNPNQQKPTPPPIKTPTGCSLCIAGCFDCTLDITWKPNQNQTWICSDHNNPNRRCCPCCRTHIATRNFGNFEEQGSPDHNHPNKCHRRECQLAGMHKRDCPKYVMVSCDGDHTRLSVLQWYIDWTTIFGLDTSFFECNKPIAGTGGKHSIFCEHYGVPTCWASYCIELGRHHDKFCTHPSILYWEWTEPTNNNEIQPCCVDNIIHIYCKQGICCSSCICPDCNDHGAGCTGDCCAYHPDDLLFIGQLMYIIIGWLRNHNENLDQILLEVSGMGEFFQSIIWLLDDILAYTILSYGIQDDILDETIAQKGILHLILNELRAIGSRAIEPPETDLNPILELMNKILEAIKELRIEINQYITNEGQPERRTWWQRIIDMLFDVLESIINVLTNFIEWIGDLLMWIIEELIMAIIRGIINITTGMIGWVLENLGAFFNLFSSNSPATRWYRDDEDWWNWKPYQEIYIYIPSKARAT
jgi:hypothetical protein